MLWSQCTCRGLRCLPEGANSCSGARSHAWCSDALSLMVLTRVTHSHVQSTLLPRRGYEKVPSKESSARTRVQAGEPISGVVQSSPVTPLLGRDKGCEPSSCASLWQGRHVCTETSWAGDEELGAGMGRDEKAAKEEAGVRSLGNDKGL